MLTDLHHHHHHHHAHTYLAGASECLFGVAVLLLAIDEQHGALVARQLEVVAEARDAAEALAPYCLCVRMQVSEGRKKAEKAEKRNIRHKKKKKKRNKKHYGPHIA